MGKLSDDFGELMIQVCTIQRFIQNDGYADVFGPEVSYPCVISHEVRSITKEDGTISTTTAQIYFDPDVVVGLRDKITFEGHSPKILKISTDHDIEVPGDLYGTTVYT